MARFFGFKGSPRRRAEGQRALARRAQQHDFSLAPQAPQQPYQNRRLSVEQLRPRRLRLLHCTFDVHVDGLIKRPADFIEGTTLNGKVKVEAKCFPPGTMPRCDAIQVLSHANLLC